MPKTTGLAAMNSPVLGARQFLACTLVVGAALVLYLRFLPALLMLLFYSILGLRLFWRLKISNKPFATYARVIAVCALVCTVLLTMKTVLGREGGTALLAAMIVIKLIETERTRDAHVCFIASSFLAMSAFLFDQSPLHALLTLIFVLVLIGCMYFVQEEAKTAAKTAFTPILKESGFQLALALPFAAVCFVLFPRLSTPLWGSGSQSFAKTGMSDYMEPGAISSLALDDTPVMRAKFFDRVPLPQQMYWRGLIFWDFDGKAWREPESMPWFRQPPEIEGIADQIQYEVLLDPENQKWLYLLDTPLVAPDNAILTQDLKTYYPRNVFGVMQYRATSALRATVQPRLPPWQRRMALRLPDRGNPQSRAFGQSLRERSNGDANLAIAEALKLFNQNFIYSFETPLLGQDPIDDFLFNTKIGFCEHFSSSFTFLMRAAGIPSRVVVGFQGGYFNGLGGYWVIRRSDAHAWSEVWIEGRGWVRIDPTAAVAPERIMRDQSMQRQAGEWAQNDWLFGARERLDLLRYYWNLAIVQFSAQRQTQLLDALGITEHRTKYLTMILVGCGIFTLLAALFFLRMKTVPIDPVLLAWLRLTARLEKRGAAKYPAEAPMAYIDRLQSSNPELAARVLPLAHAYNELRYRSGIQYEEAIKSFIRSCRRFRA